MNQSAISPFLAICAVAAAVVVLGVGYMVYSGIAKSDGFGPEGEVMAVGASPAGTTFSTARISEVSMAPRSLTSTSTSIQNTEANDRIVLDAGVYCSGLTSMTGPTGGVSTFQWRAGTTSAAAPTTAITAHPHLAMNVAVGTSTPDGYTATTTYTDIASRVWGTGTYMTFQTNATSSNASCSPFVHYIST